MNISHQVKTFSSSLRTPLSLFSETGMATDSVSFPIPLTIDTSIRKLEENVGAPDPVKYVLLFTFLWVPGKHMCLESQEDSIFFENVSETFGSARLHPPCIL